MFVCLFICWCVCVNVRYVTWKKKKNKNSNTTNKHRFSFQKKKTTQKAMTHHQMPPFFPIVYQYCAAKVHTHTRSKTYSHSFVRSFTHSFTSIFFLIHKASNYNKIDWLIDWLVLERVAGEKLLEFSLDMAI